MIDATIHLATEEDVLYVARRLRFPDVRELETASGRDAASEVIYGVQVSELALTGHINGEPAIVFGVSPHGAVWMVGTDAIQQATYTIFRVARDVIAMFLRRHKRLWNQADTRNTTHLRWLRLLGATFDEVVEVNGVPFQRFHFDRKD